MILKKLSFSGYRAFAARSPAALNRPLQKLTLSPITVLIGKNNSGKSTVGKLVHHCVRSLASSSDDPFPMDSIKDAKFYGASFRDIQHERSFFNPLDIELSGLRSNGTTLEIRSQLNQLGDGGDGRPVVEYQSVNGRNFSPEHPRHGLLPVNNGCDEIRSEAIQLLRNSCYLGPIRERVRQNYTATQGNSALVSPNSTGAVALLLLHDVELRTLVSEWMAANLDGWRPEVQQILDDVSLIIRRSGRESNLADAGEGIQQALAVITLFCWRSLGRGAVPFIDVVEQPELHLHDAGHASIADLIISATRKNDGGCILVETHSESLVLRLRRRVAEGLLRRDMLGIYFVEDRLDGSQLLPINVLSNGEVDWWPEGVFSEALVEVKAIRKAQRES